MVPFLLHVAERQRRASAQLEGRLRATQSRQGAALVVSSNCANSGGADEAKGEDLAATEWVSDGAVRKGRGAGSGGALCPCRGWNKLMISPQSALIPFAGDPGAPCGSE
jgi:hypothetical protein